MRRFGTICTSRSHRVVLPVPDGADTMNSRPRRPGPVVAAAALLNVLHLLAQLFQLGLGGNDHFGHLQPVGF